MRVHAHKITISTAIGCGASIPVPAVLTFRVFGAGEVEILTARIFAEQAPTWLLRRIENDAALIAELLAKAADDAAHDRSRSVRAELARAA